MFNLKKKEQAYMFILYIYSKNMLNFYLNYFSINYMVLLLLDMKNQGLKKQKKVIKPSVKRET